MTRHPIRHDREPAGGTPALGARVRGGRRCAGTRKSGASPIRGSRNRASPSPGTCPTSKPAGCRFSGESEYDYLATFAGAEAERRLRCLMELDIPCVVSTKGKRPPARSAGSRRGGRPPVAGDRNSDLEGDRSHLRLSRGRPRTPDSTPWRADRRLFARDADRRRPGDRQERVRAGTGLSRPPAGRR